MKPDYENMEHQARICFLEEEQIIKYVSILKPIFSRDGDNFCYLYGKNLQEGIAGFGETAYKAAKDFVHNYFNEKCDIRRKKK